MNHLLRTCKHHWAGGEYLHWARAADRKPFVPPGTAPRFAPDAPAVSRHLRTALHLDPESERAWGTTTHEVEVLAAEAGHAVFDAVALEIAAARVDGRDAAFDHDGTKLRVALPRTAARGERFTVEIEHAVTRPVAGLYFTNPDEAYPQRFRTVWTQGQDEDSKYYLPCLDAPNFKQSTEALLYVPRGWFALSNGDLVAHEPEAGDGEALWHYRMELPYSTYLFSIVAGDFAEHRERHDGMEVRWYVQRDREGDGRNAFGNTGDIVRFLADFTGVPYPYGQYTQIAVPDFIFGGMENFTVTTQTDLTLHDDRAHLDFASDDLVAHEAAHTWFGNLVTARSWAHAWLHESFATYCESLYLNHQLGRDEHDYQLLRDAEAYFHEDARYRRPIVTHRYQTPIDLFDAHLYPGGAVRLRHLHGLLGDQPFRAALRRYLEAHRCGVSETVDLARAVEAEAGQNYDWWFDQWIYSGGYPTLECKLEWKEEERTAVVTVKQTAPLEAPAEGDANAPKQGGRRWWRLPTRLLFQVGSREEVYPVTLDSEEARYVFRLSAKPRMVLLDPEFEIPCKQVKWEKPEPLLLRELERAARPVARIDAAVALAEKPSARVTEALGRALRRERFWGVQQRIARALAKIGGHAARDALLAGLAVRHPKARREIVTQLGFFREDPRVGDALSRRARRGDASYYVEAELARAVGRSRAKDAPRVLKRMLERPSHAEVIRSGAYDALGELGDPAQLDVVLGGTDYGAPAMARPAAIRAAAELGRRHQHLRHRVLEALQQVAEHKGSPAATFRTKLAAIRALQHMGDLDAVPILRRVAESEVDGRVVRLAREAADALREQAAKPAELQGIRTDLDDIAKENKRLRERVDTLEQAPPQRRARAHTKRR